MRNIILHLNLYVIILLLSSFQSQKNETFNLSVEATDLRNSTGTVLFALYIRDDAFPDEHYTKYLKKIIGKISNKSSIVTFTNLPQGKYAVSILHDENNNGKIDKGLIFPVEGIGFSNYKTIGFSNRPTFAKASFLVNRNLKLKTKAIYL